MSNLDCDSVFEAEPPPPAVSVRCLAQKGGRLVPSVRSAPEETAIAFTFNGLTHAVMMATPSDLEDFAIGFALTEGLIDDPADIASLEIVATRLGVELRAWLADDRAKTYSARRRSMAGPTGCGLCGIESLEEAVRSAPPVAGGGPFQYGDISTAMDALPLGQSLYAQTHAVHAAAFWTPGEGLLALREDVGRHNALDKLAGALRRGKHSAKDGLVLLTSRVSIELIQKAARMGAPAIVAVSAPTAAAIRLAEACGMTLIAVARAGEFEIFTHPRRITDRAMPNVA
ncbi:Putative accessory protein for molybdenum containing NAD-linked formate dehydrogenase [Methylocella tundrae]|uniref:Sulfur carrier protein FdhD n=1 Tax=Methylocella tundrae TaxID=227605 RepID=A0A8B6M115_METTU|nr:formate dehydrogenase accessory sulfurtransferase FdhD [Methylocella tundrae]VTZ28098.1 Putative accessory protein for molybdenum containing NAD-linked formate dehydrogenase [Methylocella tundrae]VTZ48526.1 Putative accessory protein for molybdenum containing NAD-linked formate dehydrogenase [Methylocella tundrae]